MKLPPPTRTTRITDADTGERFEVLDYRGSQHLPPRPFLLECDYCCRGAARLWCRPTRAHCLSDMNGSKRHVYYGGTWNACARCKPMVDHRDIGALARQASINLEMAGNEAFLDFMTDVYRVVFACQESDERIWSSGDEYPLK